jgi:putative transposase
MIWARVLAYITGTVDQELLLRNKYLAAENRIQRAQIKGRLLLSDAERATLAEIAHRLGRKALEELADVAKPDTLLAWYQKLIANKFDGSRFRKPYEPPRESMRQRHLRVFPEDAEIRGGLPTGISRSGRGSRLYRTLPGKALQRKGAALSPRLSSTNRIRALATTVGGQTSTTEAERFARARGSAMSFDL